MDFDHVAWFMDRTLADVRITVGNKEYLIRYGGFDDEKIVVEARDIENYPATKGMVYVTAATLDATEDKEALFDKVVEVAAISIEDGGEPRVL